VEGLAMPHEAQAPIGREVKVSVDRPLGSRHPEHPDLIYEVNYGYVEGIQADDGEWQDAYILGVHEPLTSFTGRVFAVIHRRDDVETKWVVAPAGTRFGAEEIGSQTHFQEKYYDTWIEL
jgi:inorganic pyrophosphatase